MAIEPEASKSYHVEWKKDGVREKIAYSTILIMFLLQLRPVLDFVWNRSPSHIFLDVAGGDRIPTF